MTRGEEARSYSMCTLLNKCKSKYIVVAAAWTTDKPPLFARNYLSKYFKIIQLICRMLSVQLWPNWWSARVPHFQIPLRVGGVESLFYFHFGWSIDWQRSWILKNNKQRLQRIRASFLGDKSKLSDGNSTAGPIERIPHLFSLVRSLFKSQLWGDYLLCLGEWIIGSGGAWTGE